MKRYNKQKVMKDAHRLYNNNFQRKGRTWGECLQTAWRWEKDAVRVREEKAAKLDAVVTASWMAHNERKNRKSNKSEFKGISPDAIAFSMGYGRNLYCGD